MRLLYCVAFAVVACVALIVSGSIDARWGSMPDLSDPVAFRAFLEEATGTPMPTKGPVVSMFKWLHRSLLTAFGKYRSEKPASVSDIDPVSPFWRFIPLYEGSAALGQTIQFGTDCFTQVTVTADAQTSNIEGHEMLGFQLTAAGQTKGGCQSYWLFTVGGGHSTTELFEFPRSYHAFINVSGLTTGERFLMTQYGLRVFTYNTSKFETMATMLDTLLLFLPSSTDAIIRANNMNYFNTFSLIQPPIVDRANPGLTGLSSSEISDGDIMFVQDLDGLGRTIALGTGGTPNHVVICLRNSAGVLQVCESTDPTVMCTPYDEWIGIAHNGARNVVLAPLGPEYRAAFNNTKAWEFINASLGLEYGYPNFLFGWIDTGDRNLPCMPPDFKRCLVYEHLEFVASWLEHLSPALASKFFGQALNHRVGTSGLSFPDVIQAAAQQGMTPGQMLSIPEDDSWLYETTRWGLPTNASSMVCSTFGCSVLRASGAFSPALADGNDISCGEQDPWNMLALKIWDEAKLGDNRPAVCKLRDPSNHYCQLSGTATFHIGLTPNQKPLIKGIGNNCPSLNPAYNRSLTC